MIEAKYYKKLENKKVQCLLCPHECIINNGKISPCMARKNIDGVLYAINYAQTTSIAIDPIEKKPLYHFLPGTEILSVAPNSCNFKCPFCQNAEISQMNSYTEYVSPKELVEIAIKKNIPSIAYTYTEPLTWFEYLMDVAPLAKAKGIKNVLVTNGSINSEPLRELLPYIDAANIDLKSMNRDFYKNVLWGDLDIVLNTIKTMKKHSHIEITNLIIPGYNDSEEEINELVNFVSSVGVDTPLHFSRYFPHHKFNVSPTPVSTLKKAWEIGKKKLYYVYIGNVYIEGASNTYCPNCKNLLVIRNYFYSKVVGMSGNKCKKCNYDTNFIFNNI